jgi:GNAT superfamily N-acetyltransferase
MDTCPQVVTAAVNVTIEPATDESLAVLVRHLPDDHDYFRDRLDRQRQGRGELLIARVGGLPVGEIYLWFDPPDEPELRDELPDTPLLQRAYVRPELRGNGIGAALFTAAEKRGLESGYGRVALAVERDNKDAIRLYERLGYHYWHCQRWHEDTVRCVGREPGPGGAMLEEFCFIMTKKLTADYADLSGTVPNSAALGTRAGT